MTHAHRCFPASFAPACPWLCCALAPPELLQGISFDRVRGAVQRARMSTRTRVAALEEEVGRAGPRGAAGSETGCVPCSLHGGSAVVPACDAGVPACDARSLSACFCSQALVPTALPPALPVQVRALGREARELRAIVQGYRDAEQRVRAQGRGQGRRRGRGTLARGNLPVPPGSLLPLPPLCKPLTLHLPVRHPFPPSTLPARGGAAAARGGGAAGGQVAAAAVR